jgi:mannose-6-phosphate isomerase-like protein (cupin superfamily)
MGGDTVNVRRVVVTQHDGRSVIASDGLSIRSHDFVYIPGMSESLLWSTRAGDDLVDVPDQALRVRRRLPGAGESVFVVVTFPPDDVFRSGDFDPKRAAAEQRLVSPDLADLFEPGDSGMHTTPTVDYVVVVEGEIWLDLGDGGITHLRQGDTVIQNATRHAWRNFGTKPATLAVVMVGTNEL